MQCSRATKAVFLHVLSDGISRGQSNYSASLRLINFADRRHGIALAGPGLSVDQCDPSGTGCMSKSTDLFPRDAPVPFLLEDRSAGRDSDLVFPIAGKLLSGIQHVVLAF